MSNSTLYLMHHGIKGQSLGVKNGPPYPLEVSDYNKAEKKFVESGKSISVDSDKKLREKGYSGMVDSIDIKTTGRGNDKIMENAPMVLFDSDSFSLRSTEKIR